MWGLLPAFRHFRAFRGQKSFIQSARFLCRRLNQRFPSRFLQPRKQSFRAGEQAVRWAMGVGGRPCPRSSERAYAPRHSASFAHPATRGWKPRLLCRAAPPSNSPVNSERASKKWPMVRKTAVSAVMANSRPRLLRQAGGPSARTGEDAWLPQRDFFPIREFRMQRRFPKIADAGQVRVCRAGRS